MHIIIRLNLGECHCDYSFVKCCVDSGIFNRAQAETLFKKNTGCTSRHSNTVMPLVAAKIGGPPMFAPKCEDILRIY